MLHGAAISGLSGNLPQLVHAMEDMKLEEGRMIRFWIERSKYKTEEEIKKYILDGFDHWITPETALSLGVVDAVVTSNKPVKKKK
jgi:ATP-dependent protease ClpP protease subunit